MKIIYIKYIKILIMAVVMSGCKKEAEPIPERPIP